MNVKFYRCKICGKIVAMVNETAVPTICCGQEMYELLQNTTEGAFEKHIPVVNYDGERVRVSVGNILHPMTKEHNIPWIYLQTDRGGQRKCLEVGKAPVVTFALSDEEPVAAYAYCNLHGLWKAEI